MLYNQCAIFFFLLLLFLKGEGAGVRKGQRWNLEVNMYKSKAFVRWCFSLLFS